LITPWVILHIPHASTIIPDSIINTFKLDRKELKDEVNKLTDHYTDYLFEAIGMEETALIFPISRFVVDPERDVSGSGLSKARVRRVIICGDELQVSFASNFPA